MQSKIRRQCFERDKYHCRHCNNTNGLHPHHIVYRSAGGKDELDNLVTVCWICHRQIHDGFLAVNASWNLEGELVILAFTRRNRKGIGGS